MFKLKLHNINLSVWERYYNDFGITTFNCTVNTPVLFFVLIPIACFIIGTNFVKSLIPLTLLGYIITVLCCAWVLWSFYRSTLLLVDLEKRAFRNNLLFECEYCRVMKIEPEFTFYRIFSILPKQCSITGKIVWFGYCYHLSVKNRNTFKPMLIEETFLAQTPIYLSYDGLIQWMILESNI